MQTKIAIAGMGGIGGYIGGKLALKYSHLSSHQIIFIARGASLDKIKQEGLVLHSGDIRYVCSPSLVSNSPQEIGVLDYLIICTKTFSVIDLLRSYSFCISDRTTIITLQNTVSGAADISSYLPLNSTLLEGCIYIVSNLIGLGEVNHASSPSILYFGTPAISYEAAPILKILNDAKIDARFTNDINTVLWAKYLFLSPAAVTTAALKIPLSEITTNRQALNYYTSLSAELSLLASCLGIKVEKDFLANNIKILNGFKSIVKSSFQLDLEQNKTSEIDSLLNYVINQAKKQGVDVPNYINAKAKIITN